MKSQPGGVLYCDGGAELLHQLLQAGLVDRWIITTVPVLLGNGIPLLDHPNRLSDFTLEATTHYNNGVVQRTYAKKLNVA
jgi:dihydrofolate reductase